MVVVEVREADVEEEDDEDDEEEERVTACEEADTAKAYGLEAGTNRTAQQV